MRIKGLFPSEADVVRIVDLATAALTSGAVGDRATWLNAVRRAGPHFDWSKYPAVEKAYREWVDRTWRAALSERSREFTTHSQHLGLAEDCALAYERVATTIEETVEKAGGTDFRLFEHEGHFLRAFGYRRGGEGFLAFRGTAKTSLKNWRLDFDVHEVEPGLHRGFLEGWLALESRIRQWLRGLPNEHLRLTLTGHSMGGAIAIVAAYFLQTEYEIGDVVTFGCPRLAKPVFAATYNESPAGKVTRRYIHETDLVPRVPPGSMFQHVGSEYFILAGGAILLSPPETSFVRAIRPVDREAKAMAEWAGSKAGSILGNFQTLIFGYLPQSALAVAVVGGTLVFAYGSTVVAVLASSVWRDLGHHETQGYVDALDKLKFRLFGQLLAVRGVLDNSPLFPGSQ